MKHYGLNLDLCLPSQLFLHSHTTSSLSVILASHQPNYTIDTRHKYLTAQAKLMIMSRDIKKSLDI
jgi:hypothetical protein